MALRRSLMGCAAGAALAATALAGATATAGAPARAAPSGRPAGTWQSTACSSAPPGYSTCLVHVLHPRWKGQDRSGGRVNPKAAPSGLSPNAIATAYGFSTTGGSGNTIAVVDAYGDAAITADLAIFSSQYGLRPCTASDHCLTTVNQTGGTNTAPAPRRTTGWGLETSLDVEWAHALAPDADILLVEATSNSDTDLFAAVRYATAKARYVTMAWGGTEFAGETAFNAAFANSSVSYFAAAGDNPSQLSYPATSPDVIAVGGTTLTVTRASDEWTSETAWATAGGGCSRYETADPAQAAYPSYDQQGANCSGKRAVPDISLDANPSTGVAVYDTDGYSGWLVAGGTSASTDMVAAHAAETSEHVSATFVYGGAIKVYNVTTGSNGHPCENGLNLCTGLGSWNTAVGTTDAGSSGGGNSPSGSLGFTSGVQKLTPGVWSGPMTVTLSKPAPGAGMTVSVSSSSSTGAFSTSTAGSSPTRSLALHVTSGATEVPTFYYEDARSGTPTIAVSATGWASATQTETVTTAAALSVAIAPGSPAHSGRSYHIPLAVTVTSSGRRVSGANVTISVFGGSCTGSRVATGSGSTSAARGNVVFAFATGTTGSYCAKATASATGAAAGSASAEFTISAALPPVSGSKVSSSRLSRAR
jgi:hypothetical protein